MASFERGAAEQEAKALQFIADGDKCLRKWSLFASSTKHEDAAECFDKAARCYKVSTALPEGLFFARFAVFYSATYS